MLRGATFDTELEERIGHAIAKEVLAYKGNLFAGVCINLPYNHGWGRSQETYGEESFTFFLNSCGVFPVKLLNCLEKYDILGKPLIKAISLILF